MAEIFVLQRPASDHLLDCFPPQQLGDDKWTNGVLPDVEHCQNIRMLHRREHLGLAQDVVRGLSIRGLDPLERHLPLELGIKSDKNFAKSALANFFLDLVSVAHEIRKGGGGRNSCFECARRSRLSKEECLSSPTGLMNPLQIRGRSAADRHRHHLGNLVRMQRPQPNF